MEDSGEGHRYTGRILFWNKRPITNLIIFKFEKVIELYYLRYFDPEDGDGEERTHL